MFRITKKKKGSHISYVLECENSGRWYKVDDFISKEEALKRIELIKKINEDK